LEERQEKRRGSKKRKKGVEKKDGSPVQPRSSIVKRGKGRKRIEGEFRSSLRSAPMKEKGERERKQGGGSGKVQGKKRTYLFKKTKKGVRTEDE